MTRPTYTDRRTVYRGHVRLGDVARFSDGTWRASTDPDAECFSTREDCIDFLWSLRNPKGGV